MPETNLYVKLLHPRATAPTRGSDKAAGLDLYACIPDAHSGFLVIPAGESAVIPTGISAKPPKGTYIRISPRSGLAVKYNIDVLAGIVDEDYRGEIMVVLINHGVGSYRVSHGDRVAQAVITPYVVASPVVVNELDDTQRGESGFGSTGY